MKDGRRPKDWKAAPGEVGGFYSDKREIRKFRVKRVKLAKGEQGEG